MIRKILSIIINIIGIILILLVVFQRPIKKITKRGFGKLLKIIIFVIISIYLLVMAGLLINVQINKTKVPNYEAKAAIVLGAGLNGEKPSLQLQKRLNKALIYSQDNKNAIVLFLVDREPMS